MDVFIHSLGLEHLKKYITNKLQQLNFPNIQTKIIPEDIFRTLYNCKDEQKFNSEFEKLRGKWMETEMKYARNKQPGQFFSALSNIRKI